MKKMRFSGLLFFLWMTLCFWAQAMTPLPFLSNYFAPAFEAGGQQLEFMNRSTEDGTDHYLFYTPDKSLGLMLENTEGDRTRVDALYSGLMKNMNMDLGHQGGDFVKIHRNSFHVRLYPDGVEKAVFVYKLPGSLQTWTYFVKPGEKNLEGPRFEMIRNFINHRIWEILSKEWDPIAPASWAPEIYEYVSLLLKEGKKGEALPVLGKLLVASSYNYRAHMDFAEITPDKDAAQNSASIVLRNSEDPELVARAAKILGKELPTLESVPFLERGGKGLQLILILLPPCDLPLLEEASRIYTDFTGIPVKIRRLREGWTWKEPERIPYQRYIREMLSGSGEKKMNFGGWDLERYVTEILKSVKSQNALARYYTSEFVERIRQGQGQYSANGYGYYLRDVLNRYISDDSRTMYVGATGLDLFLGDDNNFTFSTHVYFPVNSVGLFSYYMLKSDPQEEFQSRRRLTERMAKELVPPSFKSLGIPRSTDPSCPYSISGSISRIDQKILSLSEPLKKKIEELRKQG